MRLALAVFFPTALFESKGRIVGCMAGMSLNRMATSKPKRRMGCRVARPDLQDHGVDHATGLLINPAEATSPDRLR
jgi:hypothetical protein